MATNFINEIGKIGLLTFIRLLKVITVAAIR